MTTVPLRVYVALRGGDAPGCLGVFLSADAAKSACQEDAKRRGMDLDAWDFEPGVCYEDTCSEWTAEYHSVIEAPMRVPSAPTGAWRN